MSASDVIARFFWYRRRHGYRGTIARLLLASRRSLTGNRFVLYHCDLRTVRAVASLVLAPVRVERKKSESELEMQDLDAVIAVGHPEIVRRQISERFRRGAVLWLIKSNDKLGGYGWTLSGATMEPHYFPLGSNDVHLFDFFVFPEYRGQRINRSLVLHILSVLALEATGRAFIEAAEWNTPQLQSLSRMPFETLGCGSKFRVFGRTVVVWSNASLKRLK